MTIAVALWLIFKSILLVVAALFFAAMALGSCIGGVLASDDDAPRWLCPILLTVALMMSGACIVSMGGLAKLVIFA